MTTDVMMTLPSSPARRAALSCLALLLALGALACGEPLPVADTLDDRKIETEQDMDKEDQKEMRRRQPRDAGERPGVTCSNPEQIACGQLCTDPQTDVRHCGQCDNACGKGSACVDGECACFALNKAWCGEEICVDLNADRSHCGACGNACPAATYCDQGVCTDDGVLGEVIALTNDRRAVARDCGGDYMPAVSPLSKNDQLTVAAQKHAEDMAARNYFAHDTPDGITPTQRMRAAGFMGGATGENIAIGQRTPEQVVQAWIDSPGHCRGIMNPNFNVIGIGYYPEGPQRPYWVQNFGRN